jgi:alpha-1,3-fucosyltransferase
MIHGPEHIEVIPAHSSTKQLFIFVSLEAPTFIKENLSRYENYYNLTMTYRMDSDIKWDYGRVIAIETKEVIAPSINPQWIQPDDQFFDENYFKIYQNKTKSIAWFVSNCEAFNRRQDLVKRMQQLIDIDVYGKCGNLTCKGTDCEQLLTTTYKFYLSFENSLCQDYVSEKLYKALQQYTIPLVFNGLKDKTLFAPPKSVIDVDEFDTVEDLVNYLKFLMSNPREYLKYFWWKKHYSVERHLFRHTYCDLCQKLNNDSFMAEKHQYENIKTWYRDGMCNQTSHIVF